MSAIRVAIFEYRRHVFSRRFLATTSGLPVIMAFLVGLSVLAMRSSQEPEGAWAVVEAQGTVVDVLSPEGMLHESTVSAGFSQDWAWPAYVEELRDISSAAAAMARGETEGYVVLGSAGTALMRYSEGVAPPEQLTQVLAARARAFIVMEAPPSLQVAIAEPVRLEFSASGAQLRDANEMMALLIVAVLVPLLFTIAVLLSTGLLVSAIAEEKSRRLLEVLLVATKASALVNGKVLGLGAVSVTQTAVWLGLIAIAVGIVDFGFLRSLAAALDRHWIVSALGFFVLGYLLYAAVMVAIGMLCGEPRSAQQLSGVAVVPLTLPFVLVGVLLMQPSSPAAVLLSILPLTSPSVMPMRLLLGAVDPVQMALSGMLLAVSTVLAFRGAGAIFRARAVHAGAPSWLPTLGARQSLGRAASQSPVASTETSRASEGATEAPRASESPTKAWRAPGASTTEAWLDALAWRDVGGPSPLRGRWMRLVYRVGLHEVLLHSRRTSFVVATFVLPAASIVMAALMLFTTTGAVERVSSWIASAFELDALQQRGELSRIGLVDPGGFVQKTPAGHAGISLMLLDTAQAARAALVANEIDRAFVIPVDYPSERRVTELLQSHLPPAGAAQLERILRFNLWPEAEADQHADLHRPQRRVTHEVVERPSVGAVQVGRGAEVSTEPMAAIPALAVGMLLYIAIFSSSSFLLRSVTTEKENRLTEILLSSAPASALLTGKVVGLGLLGLAQLIVWLLAALTLGLLGAVEVVDATLALLDPSMLAILLLVFVLGYAFYASVMASIGALVPTYQESGALTFVVLFPAWIPFFVLEALLLRPEGSIARVLTLLPPTAPLMLALRLVLGRIASWEVALSLTLLTLAVIVVVTVAARLFKAIVMLRGGGATRLAICRALGIRGRFTIT